MDSLRLSDADREAALEMLSDHYSVGRLTKDEFDERSDAVWSARTRDDLTPVFADLPVHPAGAPVPRPSGSVRRRWAGGFPMPLVPVVFALIALTVVTHLPFLIVGAVVWWCWARHLAWGGEQRRVTGRH
jgi:uncharacterized membrane protein